MSRKNMKTEGGHKRGHSNVTHWEPTEWLKAESKRIRRRQGKAQIRKEVNDA